MIYEQSIRPFNESDLRWLIGLEKKGSKMVFFRRQI